MSASWNICPCTVQYMHTIIAILILDELQERNFGAFEWSVSGSVENLRKPKFYNNIH